MASYISDGFTRTDGWIAPALEEKSGERLYDGLEFTYRPATRLECVKVDAETAAALRGRDVDPECAVRAERIVCRFVAGKIVSWDLKNVGVHDVPVSDAACERLNPYLFERLYAIIRGTQVSDKKPEAERSPVSDEDQQKN